MSEAEEQYEKFPEAMRMLCDMINLNPQIKDFTWWMGLQAVHSILAKRLGVTREEYKGYVERAGEFLKNIMPEEDDSGDG